VIYLELKQEQQVKVRDFTTPRKVDLILYDCFPSIHPHIHTGSQNTTATKYQERTCDPLERQEITPKHKELWVAEDGCHM